MDLLPSRQGNNVNLLHQCNGACHLIAFFLTLVFITGFAQADMRLDRVVLDFMPKDAHHKDIQIFNNDENNLYVEIKVSEVLMPGTEKEIREPVKNLKQAALVVTPQKMIIPGNSKKSARLVVLDETGKTDRIFRVNFSPVVGELKSEVSGIKLLIAYEVLVIVRASNPVAKVVAERNGNKVTFKNTGNTNVILQNGSQCNPKDNKQCEQIGGRRLYASNSWELTLPYNGPVSFELDDGIKTVTQTFGKNSAEAPNL